MQIKDIFLKGKSSTLLHNSFCNMGFLGFQESQPVLIDLISMDYST